MKKIISLILAFTILAMMANIGIVSAEIPAGDGNGVKLACSGLVRTSPGGSPASVSTIEADGFSNAYKYVYGGGSNKTFTKFRMEFTNTQEIAADDYLYISFYYRCIEDETYTLPTYIQKRALTNDDASSKVGLDHDLTTTWQKVSYVTQSAAAVASGSNVTQMFLLGISGDAATSVEFADPTCVYFGAVTGDNPEDQIMDAIENAESAPAISVNNGKGASLAFKGINRNSPSSGTAAPISTIEDDDFGTITRYEYTEATKNIVQLSLAFTNTYAISVGDTFNVSYYYRFIDDETYNVPASMQHRDINTNSNKTTFASGFTGGEWRKASLTLTATTALAAGSDVYLRHLVNLTTGDKFCMDIAYPTCIYFGNVASENASEIDVQLSKSDFTSVSIGRNAIDLTANPTSCTTTDVVSKSDITAVGYYDSAVVKVDSEETDDSVIHTITSYAIGHDLTSTTDTKYTTYTITAAKPAPSITLNNGKGQALEFDTFVGVSPSNPEYYSVSELEGTDFEKAYRYEYLGNADMSIIQNIVKFKSDTAIPAGDYFYFSYYYRFVADDTHALPIGVQRRDSINNSSVKIGFGTGVEEEWTKAEFIVTNYAEISEEAMNSVETRFLMILGNATDKIYIDIAEPTCVYFGTATGDVEEAINEQISKSDISAITINGAPVDLAANPTSYTTSEKAEADNIAVEGYHNPSIVKKSVSKENGTVTYEITAYAVDYDFLDSTDTRKSTYTLTVAAPDYDVYDYGYEKTETGYAVNALFDNNASSAASFDYIVAAYNGDGALVGTGINSYSDVSGIGNKLSANIVTESGASYVKIFLWNSKTGLVPVINSRVID